VVHDTKQ